MSNETEEQIPDQNEAEAETTPDVAEEEAKEPELTVDEEEAFKAGWRPKKDFKGEEGEWVAAKPYLRYKKLANHVHQLNRTNTKLESKLDKLTSMMMQQNQGELNQTEARLKRDRDEAIEMADKDTVNKIDDALNAVHQRQYELKQTEKEDKQRATPEAEAWYEKNKNWFGQDQRMTAYAQSLDKIIPNQHPNASHSDILSMIDDELRERFPDKFETKPKKVTAMTVEKPTPSHIPSKVKGYKDMDAKAKSVANEFADHQGLAGDERTKYLDGYAKDYFSLIGA